MEKLSLRRLRLNSMYDEETPYKIVIDLLRNACAWRWINMSWIGREDSLGRTFPSPGL